MLQANSPLIYSCTSPFYKQYHDDHIVPLRRIAGQGLPPRDDPLEQGFGRQILLTPCADGDGSTRNGFAVRSKPNISSAALPASTMASEQKTNSWAVWSSSSSSAISRAWAFWSIYPLSNPILRLEHPVHLLLCQPRQPCRFLATARN